MMPRMSSSRIIRYDSSSILISVPPYFEISTLSPFFTVKSIFLPSSLTFPVPRATTFPSCGFSLAVSGMMIPPFFISCSSSGCTSTRSPSGLTLTAAIGCFLLLICFWVEPVAVDSGDRRRQIVVTFSCLRRRLRTLHRQRHLRPALRGRRLLQHQDLVAFQGRVADPVAGRL